MPKKDVQEIMELLDQMFIQMQIRYGRAVRGRWFYDGDGCPGCGGEIKAMKFKGTNALSLNTFIYRDHGVLIGYILCGKCARSIFKDGEKNPNAKTPLHDEIEKNLKAAFVKQLGH